MTEQRALEAPTDYEYRYLWFKVRAFESQHDHLQIVYTNAYTNTYFGIVEMRDYMTLKVRIEPTETTPGDESGTADGK